MSTESRRQGLELGVFLSLISSKRKELRSKEPKQWKILRQEVKASLQTERVRRAQAMRVEAGRQLGHC